MEKENRASSDQADISYEDIAETIRRIFYTLIGTGLFCVITLGGTFDINLVVPGAFVKLPLLNYEMSFQLFLFVGPTILIGLWIYLHVFVAQYRKRPDDISFKRKMFWDFKERTPQFLVLAMFYWMTPVTLLIFTWKAWPIEPFGYILGMVTLGVTVASIILQIKRCPGEYERWSPWLPLLSFPIFSVVLFLVIVDRQLNLSGADLKDKDLSSLDLSGADLQKANLSGALLQNSNLSGAELHGANLSEANIVNVILSEAKLHNATLDGADLSRASLDDAELHGASLRSATLSGAKGTSPILENADLSNAVLCRANLNEPDFYGANLANANLMHATLKDGTLQNAELANANLAHAKVTGLPAGEDILDRACGNDQTSLPGGHEVDICSGDRLSKDMKACRDTGSRESQK